MAIAIKPRCRVMFIRPSPVKVQARAVSNVAHSGRGGAAPAPTAGALPPSRLRYLLTVQSVEEEWISRERLRPILRAEPKQNQPSFAKLHFQEGRFFFFSGFPRQPAHPPKHTAE